MEFIPPAGHQRSQDMTVPDQLKRQLLSAGGDLVKAIHAAIRPFQIRISQTARGVQISGDDIGVVIAAVIIGELAGEQKTSDVSRPDETISAIVANILKRDLVFRFKGLSYPLTPKSVSQVAFMQTLLSPAEQLIIGIGPTGTGKTHMAIAAALNQLEEERVKRIVISRPHVVMEGEVVTPAIRQELEYDSQFEFFDDIFRDLTGYQRFAQLRHERKIELLPLGHMRGRTFNDAFIILDEAQNMTVRKMRMAVTRIGRASRMVITGDPTHIDLLDDEPSGLVHLLGMLESSDLAKIHQFETSQIISNDLVARLEILYSGHRT